jgi:hypothetical protein
MAKTDTTFIRSPVGCLIAWVCLAVALFAPAISRKEGYLPLGFVLFAGLIGNTLIALISLAQLVCYWSVLYGISYAVYRIITKERGRGRML